MIGRCSMKCLFDIFYYSALLVALFYLTNVGVGVFSGDTTIYSGVAIIIFIVSCFTICISVFFGAIVKIVSSVAFFSSFIAVSFNDIFVNAIFHSDNEGRHLYANIAFFVIGYILPLVGIVVSARMWNFRGRNT